MDIIRVLPDSVANQIAAGEVIQRPASVIKELVENAVDAGATEIRVVIKDAGKTLIQVIDNGSGMSETDVRMAFERHATSKIKNADDLFTLHTMGFRGEALPSICAISEVEVKTRTSDSNMGTRLVILGSKVVTQEPCVCDKGTVISVRKIFFNVPARRKFLKSDNVELSNIMREFERLALVNNHIRMNIDNGMKQLDLRATSLRLRIEDLWRGSLKSDHLIPIDVDTSLVKIEGFVTRPEFARRRNPLQYLIVNGRNMRHPYFHKAIVSCYDNLIASDTMPCYFMKFTVDPASIDVNIHPTKNEIKFEYEQQIWPIIVSAVKTALGKYAAVPSIDFSLQPVPIDPTLTDEQTKAPSIDYKSGYNPFNSDRRQHSYVPKDWQKLYDNFNSKTSTVAPEERVAPEQESFFNPKESSSSVAPLCIQFAAKYIITASREGLQIIDQHRAHVKILYDQYLTSIRKSDIVVQSVMFPEPLQLTESENAVLLGELDKLRSIGFNLEHEGDLTWKVTSMPTLVKNSDSRELIRRIIDSISVDSESYGTDNADISIDLQMRMALVMARSAAIRRGQKLSVAEMEDIVSRLFSFPDPGLTPDGLPVFVNFDENQLEKLF